MEHTIEFLPQTKKKFVFLLFPLVWFGPTNSKVLFHNLAELAKKQLFLILKAES